MRAKKKIMILGIIGLFIGTWIISTPAETNIDPIIMDDNVDQSQTGLNNAAVVCSWYSWAQSFTPNENTLTSVDLLIGRHGFIRSDLELSVRSDLNGEDLTTVSVPYNDGFFTFPSFENFEWMSFDFPDISVNVGETYYIVLNTDRGLGARYSFLFSYGWGDNDDPESYPDGECWFSNIFGTDWMIWSQPFDFCFKTLYE